MNVTNQYIKMCDCEEVQCNDHIKQHCIPWNSELNIIPYQHNIQALIFQYGNCQYKLLTDFYEWCAKNETSVKGRSMEEMWLMFYMWRDHYKVWDGEKWIKE